MTAPYLEALSNLARAKDMLGKGFLGLALVITDKARTEGLPLDPDAMMTRGGGQVKGAGGARVKTILAENGIERRLSSEGGRTSRGTPEKMRAYVAFLNEARQDPLFDIEAVLRFWIGRVRDYFAGQPFVLDLDPALGMSGAVRSLIAKVEVRQRETPGATLVGTVVQHLIGAKLEIVLEAECGSIAQHGASVNDAKGRGGDLELGDTVLHITTAPGQLLVEKCANNINAGFRPIIITGRERQVVAEGLIADAGLSGRVDVLDYEQFLSANVFELGRFTAAGRREAIERIVRRYNELIDRVEGDPSLSILVQ